MFIMVEAAYRDGDYFLYSGTFPDKRGWTDSPSIPCGSPIDLMKFDCHRRLCF